MFWIYFLILFFGFLPLAVVLIKRMNTSKFIKRGTPVMGVITDIFKGSDSSLAQALIRYQVKQTGDYIFKRILVSPHEYKTGDNLPLFYDPAKPHEMRMAERKGAFVLLVFVLIIALLSIGICIKLSRDLL